LDALHKAAAIHKRLSAGSVGASFSSPRLTSALGGVAVIIEPAAIDEDDPYSHCATAELVQSGLVAS
jgi:hypothetical protein